MGWVSVGSTEWACLIPPTMHGGSAAAPKRRSPSWNQRRDVTAYCSPIFPDYHAVIKTRVPRPARSYSSFTSSLDNRTHPIDAGEPSFASSGVPWM